MALEIKLNQKLSQTLVMTPQLQQAIKLLQLGRQEYLEVIEKELLENPVLEELSDLAPDNDGGSSNPEGRGEEVLGADRAGDGLESSREELGNNISEALVTQALEQGIYDSSDYSFQKGSSGSFDGERPSVESFVSNPEGMTSHLLWQLRTMDLSPTELQIAAQIIGNLDKNGYLACDLAELAEECQHSYAEVEEVLKSVHTLDPPGIGARSLQECLLIQLEQLGYKDTLSWRIVENHLPDLELRKYDIIAKKEQISLDDVYEAIKNIQRLEPRPGRPFVDEAPHYITPDVYVRKVGDEYVVSLNDAGIPKLRLSSQYQELLQGQANKSGAADKEYLQERIRAASWLIKSIHQRQQTIFRVTESIMKFQREFLELGIPAMKPLVLKDIAADVGMHESTVSRVTTNKYVHTPQGVFELKFFFSSGLKSGGGEVSSESVKEKIRDLIAKENPKKPLSDQALVASLRADGIDIARRTVAKYREMMHILSSSRRKKVF